MTISNSVEQKLYIIISLYLYLMAKVPSTHLLIELDVKTHTELKHLAVDEGMPMAEIVRRCIKTWIDKKKVKVVY